MEKFYTKEGKFGRGLFAQEPIKRGEEILEFKGPIISFKEALLKTAEQQSYPLQIGQDQYIDTEIPGVLVNHSCKPNTGVTDDKILVATQEIRPDEELYYDYSTTMDEDHWTMQCLCGNSNCRGIIEDFKYLPQELQRIYLDLNVVQKFIKDQIYRAARFQNTGHKVAALNLR